MNHVKGIISELESLSNNYIHIIDKRGVNHYVIPKQDLDAYISSIKEVESVPIPSDEDIEIASCEFVEELDADNIDPAIIALHCYQAGAKDCRDEKI